LDLEELVPRRSITTTTNNLK